MAILYKRFNVLVFICCSVVCLLVVVADKITLLGHTARESWSHAKSSSSYLAKSGAELRDYG